MHERATPTTRAREIVAGAYDTHVHVAPDVVPRLIDDVTLARRFSAVGLAGFVLKSHYVPTAERAAVLRAAVPGADAVGALTLNVPVGGMNPMAIEIAGRGGARVVWFPTVDSVNQRTTSASIPVGATPPMWMGLQTELREEGIDPPPVAVLDAAGQVTPDVAAVLKLMAKHDLVLATGHLSADEIMVLVPVAWNAGVRRIIVTHPEFPSQRLTADQQKHLTGYGALMERCFTTPFTGKVAWETMIENIVQVGAENSLLSSDLGQPSNPPVEDGLALMVDHLLGAGISAEDLHRMTVTNSVAILNRSPVPAGAES